MTARTLRRLGALIGLLACAALLSCDVSEYCVTCAVDDGGVVVDGGDDDGDGGVDGGGDGDGGGPADAREPCFPSGAEVCDDLDNDCDGTVDESTVAEPLPEVGEACGGTMGVCTPGTQQCVAGEIRCSGVEGGPGNPMGARALYLFQDGVDTLYRIHGTNEPSSIGKAVSAGCIRMLNQDVIDLYDRVGKGAKVIVK